MPTLPTKHRTKASGAQSHGRSMQQAKHRVAYDSQWKKFAQHYRLTNPFCRQCEATGLLVQTQAVDHILPLALRPDLKFDLTNLQPLCARHHAQKSVAERGWG